MPARIPKDPSPMKAGLIHSGLSLLTLGLIFGSAGGIIHLMGNADAGSPHLEIALFDENGEVGPNLKTRLRSDQAERSLAIASLSVDRSRNQPEEPSLGVEYGRPSLATRQASSEQAVPSRPDPGGIRINGKLVAPGQSLSQLGQPEDDNADRKTVIVGEQQPQGAQATTVSAETVLSRVATPFEKYSIPFENADGKPTVSIIVGGMGINRRHTQAAIDELPAEVTLSFAPGAKNLPTWVRRARADGHEVLIELPMEPYSYGRTRPHPQILRANASDTINAQRLNSLLRRVSGYYGVINYQGAKFATHESASQTVLSALKDKGFAFFEDGSLTKSVFEDIATKQSMTFAKSETVIDALPEGDPIEAKLMYLESQARTNGQALGTAFAYPISIDMIKDWTASLEAKGLTLAPASYYARQQNKAQTLSVQTSGQALQSSL
ncbi:MAG: divergent polysaccharide deacetylase family protein [Pseudomonadota bacterium]